jgi:flagellin
MSDNILLVEQLNELYTMRKNEAVFNRTVSNLTSGLTVESASDDPSGYSLSTLFTAEVRGSNTAIQNLQHGLSIVGTSIDVLREIEDSLQCAREVAVKSLFDTTITTTQKLLLQSKLDEILSSIDDIVDNASYMGKYLVNGGTGASFFFDTQTDLQTGYSDNPVNSIDLIESPGSAKLALVPWTDTVAPHSTAAGAENYVSFKIDSISYGIGTTTATVSMECNSILNTPFTGSLTFGAGTTINATGGTGITSVAGTSVNFNFNAGPAGKHTITATITAPNDTTWNIQLTKPINRIVSVFYGATELYSKQNPGFDYTDYFTTINPMGAYYSTAIDTGDTSGTASISYGSTLPAGTALRTRVEQSATGAGGWTDLGYFQSGETFDFTQQYLRFVCEMTSPGISSGAPSLDSMRIVVESPQYIQSGPDNNISQQVALDPVDARSDSLGLRGLSILAYYQTIASYDSSSEMLSGLENLVNIDLASDPGYFQLSSPISNENVQAAVRPKISTGYTVTQLADGRYSITFTMVANGRDMDGAGPDDGSGFIGNIKFMDAEGNVVPINTINTINWGGGAGVVSDQYTANGAAGAWTDVDFTIRNSAADNGFTFTMVADPDIRWVMDVEVRGIDSHIPSVWPWFTNNYTYTNVWNGNTQIANAQGAGIGDLHLERRLGEYAASGSFNTVPVYVGSSVIGNLDGITNDPTDAAQYQIEESANGVNGWTVLTAYGGGTSFVTSSSGSYIRVIAQVTGTPAVWSANPYSYTESTSPRVAGFSIIAQNTSISAIDSAISRVDQYMLKLSDVQSEILREINVNQDRSSADGNVVDRIKVTDLPSEIINLLTADLTTTTASEMLNSTNSNLYEKAKTLLGIKDNDNNMDFLAVDMRSLLQNMFPQFAKNSGPDLILNLNK